jgi:hypothetical protein
VAPLGAAIAPGLRKKTRTTTEAGVGRRSVLAEELRATRL